MLPNHVLDTARRSVHLCLELTFLGIHRIISLLVVLDKRIFIVFCSAGTLQV